MVFCVSAGFRVVALLFLCIPSTLNGASDFCSREGEDDYCVPNMSFNLTRIDGKKVNHTWTVQVNEYKTLTLHTRSMQPQIIEIPHFLSEMESDHIVKLAKKEGLHKSTVRKDSGISLHFFDYDDNEIISVPEMQDTIEDNFLAYFDKEDILEMYTALGMENVEGEITEAELFKVKSAQLSQYMESVLAKQPEKQLRYSETAVLFPNHQHADDVFITIYKRLSKVLQLPVELIRMSEFQIVKYGVKGHYNTHFDSNPLDKSLPCCKLLQQTGCRPCRYLTALFYLNEVEKGGETAFLRANNATLTDEEWTTRGNLFHECQGLRVLPEKGKAVIWYNHFVDPNTGWLGERDNNTVHGGCNVLKGEKWIANVWVRLTDKETDLHEMDKLRL